MTAFAQVLKDVRQSLGLSQAALALELQSTQRHLSFLETGRSQPTASFVSRICRVLDLNIAQRVNLYAASGLPNPYKTRDLGSQDVTAALNMLQDRVLANWPFPALVLDPDWTVLRSNAPFERMFSGLMPDGNAAPNLLAALVSEPFLSMVQNWDDVAGILYYRMQRSAAHSPFVAGIFTEARAQGRFDTVEQGLTGPKDIPVFVPIRLRLPDGPDLEMSSLLGQLASCQDALVEGLEIELMVPLTAHSEDAMRKISATL